MTEPSIEEQIADLVKNGWKPKTPTIWKSPRGNLYLGPYGAWKIMRAAKPTGEGE